MALRLIVLASVLVACQAGPIWYIDNGIIPGSVFYREARSPDFLTPSIAYGFGSGFSSNIAGIPHSSSIGASFQSGNAEASGAGSAGSDGHSFARGVGYANANPTQQLYRTNPYPYGYSAYNGPRDSYGNAISSAQTFGNYGSTVAQAHNAPYNFRNAGYGSAAASGTGYGSSATTSTNGSGTAISSAQSQDASGGYNSVVSATQNIGNVRASTAHSTQQRPGGTLQQSGASSFQSPGIQAAHTTVINAAPGYY